MRHAHSAENTAASTFSALMTSRDAKLPEHCEAITGVMIAMKGIDARCVVDEYSRKVATDPLVLLLRMHDAVQRVEVDVAAGEDGEDFLAL